MSEPALADLMFFVGMPALVELLIRYHESSISYTLPTERDRRKLSEKHGILRFSVQHTRTFRFLAFALVTAALWSARTPYWPYATILLALGGISTWMLRISWFLAVRIAK